MGLFNHFGTGSLPEDLYSGPSTEGGGGNRAIPRFNWPGTIIDTHAPTRSRFQDASPAAPAAFALSPARAPSNVPRMFGADTRSNDFSFIPEGSQPYLAGRTQSVAYASRGQAKPTPQIRPRNDDLERLRTWEAQNLPRDRKPMLPSRPPAMTRGAFVPSTSKRLPHDGRLGWLAEISEGGRNGVATVSTGRNDPGGVSYGANQLSTPSMRAFLKNEEFGQNFAGYFAGAEPGTAEFERRYNILAARHGDILDQQQHNYLYLKNYRPAEEHAESLGWDMTNRAMQEAVWSAAIQHGGVNTILDRAARSGIDPRNTSALIREIYRQRARYVQGMANEKGILARLRDEEVTLLDYESKLRAQREAPRTRAPHR